MFLAINCDNNTIFPSTCKGFIFFAINSCSSYSINLRSIYSKKLRIKNSNSCGYHFLIIYLDGLRIKSDYFVFNFYSVFLRNELGTFLWRANLWQRLKKKILIIGFRLKKLDLLGWNVFSWLFHLLRYIIVSTCSYLYCVRSFYIPKLIFKVILQCLLTQLV